MRAALLTLFVATLGWQGLREPRLDARSMFDLSQSSQRMKEELRLTGADADALDVAVDLLVGDDVRQLLDDAESSEKPKELVARMQIEAQILAPVDGLSFDEVLAAAADARHAERLASLPGLTRF